MKSPRPHINTLEKTCFIVTSYISSRVLRRDVKAELHRLETQPKHRSYAEMVLTIAVLFSLALLAASFGWIGLGLYFAAVVALFH